MAKSKNPHKHTPSPIDPKFEAYLANKMKKENEKARIAGAQYGVLCMGMIALMATLVESEVPKIQRFIIDASEVMGRFDYLPIDQLVDEVNKAMGCNITNDDLVNIDPDLGKFLA